MVRQCESDSPLSPVAIVLVLVSSPEQGLRVHAKEGGLICPDMVKPASVASERPNPRSVRFGSEPNSDNPNLKHAGTPRWAAGRDMGSQCSMDET
jgi:hypothetical protein